MKRFKNLVKKQNEYSFNDIESLPLENVTKYIKKITKNENHPIIDVDFVNIPDFNYLYQNNFARKNYGDLHVEGGRRELNFENYDDAYRQFQDEFEISIDIITKYLLSLDTISYPIHGDKDFWYQRRIKDVGGRHAFLTLDDPGFHMSWHTDNRLIVASGIINVNDNEVSTIFQKSNKGELNKQFVGNKEDLIHIAQKEKNKGTFWLNTNDMWHMVPETPKERRIILVNCFF